MKKFSLVSSFLFSISLISSCSSVKSQTRRTPSADLVKSSQSSSISNDDVFIKTPKTKSKEYTHELAEADANDQIIKQEVGAEDIDADLEGSESDNIPYSRSFLALKKTKRMQFWVNYFTKKNRDRFQRFINNGEEYRPIIQAILREYGLPEELYYVGLIESGYYLAARSHASAVGPWQFIKATGRRYGLKVTSEIDERQDLFKASRAAAMYFKDLHKIFSSWELALAAYNAGENGIIRRIIKHGTRDFYELSRRKLLHSETINYVPKVLAAMHIIKNAKTYGFELPVKKVRLFDLTELKAVKTNVPLKTIAKRLNVSPALLKKLNPELKKNSTPKYLGSTYYLRVPGNKYSYQLDNDLPPVKSIFSRPETRRSLNRRIAQMNQKTMKNESSADTNILPKFYKVRRGDTLVSIARKNKMTPRELAKINHFKSWKTNVKVGQKLKLVEGKAPAVVARTFKPKIKMTNRPIVYKVSNGDNLTNIARLFDTKVSKIKKVNNLKANKVLVGQKIILPGTKKGIYTVRKGDKLVKVAKALNQPLDALIKINSLKQRSIYPGQKIIVNMD